MDEFSLIENFIRPVNQHPVLMGRGDDCSVVELTGETCLIETTDCLVEDIHFRTRDFSFSELAYKAFAVNVSDIAAMGGQPVRAHLNLAVPARVTETQFGAFFDSFYQVADLLGVALVGGDLSASPGPIFVNLHISGEINKQEIKWRHGLGEPGVLCVTGPLGDSSAGFHCLENKWDEPALIKAHKRPPLEVAKGRWLAQQPEVQGMMDLSDGLASDLKRIQKGAITIESEKVPMSLQLLKFCENRGLDPLRWSLCGGEDYRLLLNCQKDHLDSLLSHYQEHFSEPLSVIGAVENSSQNTLTFLKNQKPFAFDWTLFKHF